MVRRHLVLVALLAATLAPTALLAQDLPEPPSLLGTIDPNGFTSTGSIQEAQSMTSALGANPVTPETLGTIDPNGAAATLAPVPSLANLITWFRMLLPL